MLHERSLGGEYRQELREGWRKVGCQGRREDERGRARTLFAAVVGARELKICTRMPVIVSEVAFKWKDGSSRNRDL